MAAMAALIAAVGCSAPPEKERHQAEGAIAAAREAEAATYAPVDLRTAEDALQKYDAAVAQRDYRQALSLALEARDTAYQAAKRSGDEKAAARSLAERLVDDATQLIQTGHTHLKTQPAPARLRAAMTAAESALQDARAAVSRQDYRGAVTSLTPVVEDLKAELDAVAPHRLR
jgi:hypothetical protein